MNKYVLKTFIKAFLSQAKNNKDAELNNFKKNSDWKKGFYRGRASAFEEVANALGRVDLNVLSGWYPEFNESYGFNKKKAGINRVKGVKNE